MLNSRQGTRKLDSRKGYRMRGMVLVLATLPGAASSAAEDPSTPKTRLYVRTNPPGATVYVDDIKVGVSNGLFEVAPGRHAVRLEREGYQPHRRRVRLLTGRI